MGHEAAQSRPRVGILALQGAVQDHEEPLHRLGAASRQVRRPEDLQGLDALILPGGESTVMANFLHLYGLDRAIREHVRQGMPVLGICAGAILLCMEVDGRPGALRLLPAKARRNAYGRQLASFTATLDTPAGAFEGIFIRAPILEPEPGTEVLCTHDARAVLLRSGIVVAATFHPERTGDDRIHAWFLSSIRKHAFLVGQALGEGIQARSPPD